MKILMYKFLTTVPKYSILVKVLSYFPLLQSKQQQWLSLQNTLILFKTKVNLCLLVKTKDANLSDMIWSVTNEKGHLI